MEKLRKNTLKSLYDRREQEFPLNGRFSFRCRTDQEKVLSNLESRSQLFRKLLDGIIYGDKDSFERAVKKIRKVANSQGVTQ